MEPFYRSEHNVFCRKKRLRLFDFFCRMLKMKERYAVDKYITAIRYFIICGSVIGRVK